MSKKASDPTLEIPDTWQTKVSWVIFGFSNRGLDYVITCDCGYLRAELI